MKAIKKEETQQDATKEVFIEASQLKKLNDFEAFMNDAKLYLGDLTMQYESKKAGAMQQIAVQDQKMIELKAELEAIHGPAEVDLKTGRVIIKE